jgi:hypothetical protein
MSLGVVVPAEKRAVEEAEHTAAVMLSELEVKLRDEMDDQVRVAVSAASAGISRRLLLRMQAVMLADDAAGSIANASEQFGMSTASHDAGRDWWHSIHLDDATALTLEHGVDAVVSELQRLRQVIAHYAHTASSMEDRIRKAVLAKHARELRAADKRARASILAALTTAHPSADPLLHTGTLLAM